MSESFRYLWYLLIFKFKYTKIIRIFYLISNFGFQTCFSRSNMHSAPTNVGTEVNTPMYPGGRRISSNPGSFRGSVRILQNACREEGPSQGISWYIMVYHFLQRKLCKLLSMQPSTIFHILSINHSRARLRCRYRIPKALIAMLRGS